MSHSNGKNGSRGEGKGAGLRKSMRVREGLCHGATWDTGVFLFPRPQKMGLPSRPIRGIWGSSP